MPIWSEDYLFRPDGSIAHAIAKAKAKYEEEHPMTPAPQAAARIREALEEYDACTNYEQEAKASRRLDSVANPEALRALLAERDELSNEVHDVRAAFEGSRAIIAALKAERDELAKDAARRGDMLREIARGLEGRQRLYTAMNGEPDARIEDTLRAIDAALTNKD